MLDIFKNVAIISHVPDAGVAHPVERHLAKVEVASSSLVTRSIKEADAFASASFFVFRQRRNLNKPRHLYNNRPTLSSRSLFAYSVRFTERSVSNPSG